MYKGEDFMVSDASLCLPQGSQPRETFEGQCQPREASC
jgi:hypothetical protein